jgi:hypothetical protein
VGHDVLVAKKKQQKTEKARAGADKQLEAAAKKLRAQLGVAEKSAEKWRSRAKEHRSTATKAKAELTAVRRRLEKAEASATKWKARAQAPAPAPSPASAASATPDDSWNVTRLRAEARSRGVAGYSRKSKEQLLAELGG